MDSDRPGEMRPDSSQKFFVCPWHTWAFDRNGRISRDRSEQGGSRIYTDVRSYGLSISCGERLAAGFSLGETEISTGDPRGSLVNPRSLGLRRQLPGSRRALQDETVAESI